MRKKHIWLPTILFIYMCCMAWIGRQALFIPSERVKYFITLFAELTILVALHFFLKKKEQLRREREEDMNIRDSID